MAEENNIYTPPSLVEGAVKSFGNAEAITADVISAHNIQDLPDRPNAPTSYGGYSYSARDLKERFEGLARLAINAINTLINELGAGTVSSNIKIPDWSKAPDPDNPSVTTLNTLVNAVQSGALANAIKVDTVVDYGDLNVDKDDKNLSTLQDVLTYLTTYVSTLKTDIVDGDLAKAIKVEEVSEVGYGDGDETVGETFSTLQDVLTYLAHYVSALNTAKGNGNLAKDIYVGKANINDIPVEYLYNYLSELKFYVNTLEANLNNGLILNRIIAKNHGTIYEKNLSEVLADLETDIAQVESNANKAYRYKGSTLFENLENFAGNPKEGDVWNISNSFKLDDKTYPAGTNVAWNATGKKWDPLGGYIDYGSLAAEIKVTPYSGKTVLQKVLDILSTPWDLIITNADDLGMLSTASGNVLVRLEGEYTKTLKITLSEGLKLLDFGYSTIKEVRLTATISANTIVRNLNTIPPVDITTGEENGYLDNFGAVENCRGILRYTNCSSIENSDIKEAVSCSHIRDCTVVYSESSATAIFEDCNFINNVDVSGYAAVNSNELHFSHCHHISNIHDYYEQGSSPYISYSECNFVDPYTCAGYVQTKDIGKVPVPTAQGGVRFEEFVEQLPNNSASYTGVYARYKNNGAHGMINATSGAIGGAIPLRTPGGQLLAPNQSISKSPPDNDDQYVSKRFTDEHYVPKILNTSGTLHVYAQMAEKDGGAVVLKSASPSNASQGVVPIRSDKGQIKAPNQITHTPDLDDYISRRYFEKNLPSGGGGDKLYRHDVYIADFQDAAWKYTVYLTFYTHSATPFTDVSAFPIEDGASYPCIGTYGDDIYAEPIAIFTEFDRNWRDGSLRILRTYLTPSSSNDTPWYTIVPNAGGHYTFIDRVTEVT